MLGLTNSYTAEPNLVNPVEDGYSWLANSRVKKNKHLVNPLKLSNAKHRSILGCQAFNPFDYHV